MKYVLIVVLCTVSVAYVAATAVKECPNNSNGLSYTDLADRVVLQNCTKPPCRARKDSFLKVEYKFTPDKDYKDLHTRVTAEILGTALPFPGVDGQSACKNIYEEDKTTVVKDCEVKAGKDYYYLNGFEVLRIYPRIKTNAHWELYDPKTSRNIMCFEFLVRITN
ncbi:NPC intracellular cholesterol transporter 2 homolog a [Diabrotica undecimpunctata]|uniref:NPC intracellular cholesterol transporter 2 homolog a n=1 Tax=Diabrotica undecimpunctata TaxID=50387 RepID=UPI003B63A692